MMNVVLLRMAHWDEPAVWREATVPNITTLKTLGRTIQKEFALSGDGAIEYEVLGNRAPGCRARLRDLIVSGVTRFRYLQGGAREQQVEIVIVSPPGAHQASSIARSKDRPFGTAR